LVERGPIAQACFNGNLQEAIYKGDMDIVRYLVERGADVNTKSHRWGNAIQATSALGKIDIFNFLKEYEHQDD
jgi:ankyrin repeat protein